MEPVKSRSAKRRARLKGTAILKSKTLTQDFLAHLYYPSGWWPHGGAEDGYCFSKSADLDVLLASLEPDQAENGTTVVSAAERLPAMDPVQNDEAMGVEQDTLHKQTLEALQLDHVIADLYAMFVSAETWDFDYDAFSSSSNADATGKLPLSHDDAVGDVLTAEDPLCAPVDGKSQSIGETNVHGDEAMGVEQETLHERILEALQLDHVIADLYTTFVSAETWDIDNGVFLSRCNAAEVGKLPVGNDAAVGNAMPEEELLCAPVDWDSQLIGETWGLLARAFYNSSDPLLPAEADC